MDKPRIRIKAGSAVVPYSAPVVKACEGEYRDGPWSLPVTGGWLPQSWGSNINWWQLGYDPLPSGNLAIIEACVSAYAQTIAMCPGDHWKRDEKGGHQRVSTSALSRILRRPNGYQRPSDFLLNLVRALYLDGNAYALALRNDRFEVAELHLMQSRQCGYRLGLNGDIFYYLGGNEIVDRQFADLGLDDALHGVPARDVLHVKLHTPRHPLKGETPLSSAMLDVVSAGAMAQQSLAFATNQSRPSGILQTDQILSKEQIDMLRDKWNEHSQGLNQGKVPITAAGLKWQSIAVSAKDAETVELLKMSEQHIALAFRMPLQILGIGGTPFASTEALMQSWIASGLGFAINHVEEAFGHLFGLTGWPNDYCGFDTSALLRSNFKERIEGLARGTLSGIYAPNEARDVEGLGAVEFGDEPRLQAQVVPLSAAQGIPSAPTAPTAPSAPAVTADQEANKEAEDANRAIRHSFRRTVYAAAA